MKGTIFNIQRYSIHDGPGIRTIVFLKGCPMHCRWCSNPEALSQTPQVAFNKNLCIRCNRCIVVCPNQAIQEDKCFGKVVDPVKCTYCGLCVESCPQSALKLIGKAMDTAEIIMQVKKDIPFFRKTNGGVTISGGEPTFQADFLSELLTGFKANHISTAIETSGMACFEAYKACMNHIDLFLYDIKHMDSKIHKQLTGCNNEKIIDNLIKIDGSGKRIWIRVPLIGGINDSYENIERIFDFVAGLKYVERIELLPYHEYGAGKYAQIGMYYDHSMLKAPDDGYIDDLVKKMKSTYPSLKVVVRKY